MLPSIVRTAGFRLTLILILGLSLYFRSSGLFRGLERYVVFHPDTPKQVLMLSHYLHGNSVLYRDIRTSDGYPYGLNRVDMALIRVALWITVPAHAILSHDQEGPTVPFKDDLFYWGRCLRVLYGMAVVGLVFVTVQRMTRRRIPALAAAALYGLAPLGATVTHSVSGDVGVDLFIALGIYAATRFAESGATRWLAGFALACGMAFGCKFQGLLGLWIGLIPAIFCPHGGPHPRRHYLRRALAMLAGFLIGVVASTPGFLVDPSKTWRLMRANFVYIRDYGVAPEFLAMPALERAIYGLTHNVPLVVKSLGFGLTLLSLIALIAALGAVLRVLRTPATDDATRRRAGRQAWLFLAMASFPWMSILLATAMKPVVQPFHFSFLLPAMAVAAGVWLHGMLSSPRRFARPAAGLLLAIAVAELLRGSLREDFFWSRPEIMGTSSDFSQALFGTPKHGVKTIAGERVLKRFYTEPAILSVFRNRPSGLKSPHAGGWSRDMRFPGPAIPLPGQGHWIFMNGPIFPKNDRMFTVPATGPGMWDSPDAQRPRLMFATFNPRGAWIHHTLVFDQRPTTLRIGLRTGHLPARYDIDVEGSRGHKGFLQPHSQTILTLTSLKTRYAFKGSNGQPDVYGVPLRLRTQLGPLWATVLAADAEVDRYLHHGPTPPASTGTPAVTPDIDAAMRELRYIESTGPMDVTDAVTPLPGSNVPLEAGAYVLTAHVKSQGSNQNLRLMLVDPTALDFNPIQALHTTLVPGEQEIVWRFTKNFVPYDAVLVGVADAPGATITSWRLDPDRTALSTWPPPAQGIADVPTGDAPAVKPLNIRYPGIGTLSGIAIADTISAGRPFPFTARFDLDEAIKHKVFRESVIFLHLMDEQGRQVVTLDIPLSEAALTPGMWPWQPGAPLPAGRYRLEGGVYNARTRIRDRFEAAEGIEANRRRQRALLTTVTVIPDHSSSH